MNAESEANDPLDDLFWRDELLQILYWMRGEGLQDVVVAADLVPLLLADEALVQRQLQRLLDDGYVAADGDTGYCLTEMGITEGARRFADAFEGMTGQGHGVCNNPFCDCHRLGPEACTVNVPHTHD